MSTRRDTEETYGNVEYISPHALALIHNHCDTDEEFVKGENAMDGFIFGETEVPWSILWGHIDEFVQSTGSTAGTDPTLARDTLPTSNGPYRPEWMNSADYRKKLRIFQSRAYVVAQRQNFVAYWVLDDDKMSDWVYTYARANVAMRSTLPPPFGIIESDEALFGRILIPAKEFRGSRPEVLSRLAVIWWQPQNGSGQTSGVPTGIPRGVKACIFESHNPRFMRPTPEVHAEMVRKAKKSFSMTPSVIYSDNVAAGSSQNVLIPSSAIYALIRDKNRIREAQANMAQAEGVLVQGGVILQMQRPNLDRINGASHAFDNLMGSGTTLHQLINDASEEQRYTWDEWEARDIALKRTQNPFYDSTPEGQKTSTDRHRLAFNRPARFENQLKIMDSMAATHVMEPKVITDLEALQTKYSEDVAELLGLIPPRMIQMSRANNGRLMHTGSTSGKEKGVDSIYQPRRDTPVDNHLQHSITNARNWHHAFFEHMYMMAFHDLDMKAIDGLLRAVQMERIHMREAKLAAKALEHELRREIQAELDRKRNSNRVDDKSDDGDDTNAAGKTLERLNEVKKVAGTKSDRKRVKVKLHTTREWVDYLRTRPDALARLEFQPGSTQLSARQLDVGIGLLRDGLVSAASVQPYADIVLPGVKLIDPPDPKMAGPTGGKPKK